MAFDRKSAEEEFDNFLMNMDDQLDWLSRKAEEHGIELDVGLDDLSKLEKLFDLLSDGKDKDYVSRLVVTFARFLGEIVRENYGGKWTLPLDDEKNINFNTPVIVGHVPIDGLEFAPLSVMRAYALRRKQGTLRRAVDAQVNPKPVDLSGLEEE
ncbi:hypothetical protein IST455A_00141 [Burkholderia multivorans]|uniref:hypothetical protein n=1 Tax=Burkholderia multivorans TaxID=87883 RepID=UPI0019C3EC3B|nr:hypothetical protein [Burkholderia multivorans]MBU9333418.1 hypothetical protein [Burkholderia multivorans]CAB5279037.1 hypothetical protein IST419_00363 [Burkholderia multivorans]CAB5285190.1 hypothetical protein IST455A_00141 [Burkholderia multivorans]CAB5287476.1 hypothetical protein IST455B_00141 [Burkholderia multivorans]CAB5288353.1 hypothetical protein IST453_00364 [Burkholderia multivorans]